MFKLRKLKKKLEGGSETMLTKEQVDSAVKMAEDFQKTLPEGTKVNLNLKVPDEAKV